MDESRIRCTKEVCIKFRTSSCKIFQAPLKFFPLKICHLAISFREAMNGTDLEEQFGVVRSLVTNNTGVGLPSSFVTGPHDHLSICIEPIEIANLTQFSKSSSSH